jgi:UV DNA damage endonuclease
MTTRFGYACINMPLSEQKPKVFCGRSMIKKTFDSKGISYASQLAVQNTIDLIKIISWNRAQGVEVFRITSCLFPWASEYELSSLPDFRSIRSNLELAGKLALECNQRLSFHPGQFNVLTSPRPHVVKNCVKDLTIHGEIFDIMNMPRTPESKINIHIGGAYGDRHSATDRWCKNFELLPESVQSRLTVENDDKPNMYSTKMLYDMVHKRTGVPIVFDSHHFECGPQDSTYDDAFLTAVSTWPTDIRPQCHHSNSRKIYEDPTARIAAHSDWYYKPFDDCGFDVDVILECKMKDRGLFKYLNDFVHNKKKVEKLAA